MKMQWKTIVGLATLAICLSLPAMAAEEEGERGGRWKRFQDRRQQNGEEGEGGKRGKGQMPKQMEDLPGAKEEFARHQEAMKAIREKGKEVHEKIRESMKDAKSEEERQQIKEQNKGTMRSMAGESFDEMLNHQQKLLDLRKANKEAILDKMMERMMKGGKRGKGDREGGKDMDRRRGGGRDKGRGGRGGDVGDKAEAPEGNAATEDEISRALEEALK